MDEKSTSKLTKILLIIVSVIFIYFLIGTGIAGYNLWIWDFKNLNFAATGQFGDFIGGFLGTIINSAAFYFLYLTLNEQRKSGYKQSTEGKLSELIRLHRENINELRYSKFERGNMRTSESRKVFRIITQEFLECFQEVKRFMKMYPEISVIKPEYQQILENIRTQNLCKATVEELALIDIAFSLFYFGVSKESDTVLMHKFYHRYNYQFTNRLRIFLQLKPKEENDIAFANWKIFKGKVVSKMKADFEDIYQYTKRNGTELSEDLQPLYLNITKFKYYGGHQHRLGHYFRHLFQSFKFISKEIYLSDREKYFYAKTIRAQLSTYEQFLLFFNSLSSLGMRWEYTAEVDDLDKDLNPDDFRFITRYNLIKNLPGSQYYDFTYRQYYPKVRYEYTDDITYLDKIKKINRLNKNK